jgi:hypothetical protein
MSYYSVAAAAKQFPKTDGYTAAKINTRILNTPKERFVYVRDGGQYNHHHEAVCMNNTHTVELRIFDSSTDLRTVLRRLEFTESLVRFVAQCANTQVTVFDYVQFVMRQENRKRYRHMMIWLAAKNYIGHERKKFKNKVYRTYCRNLVPLPKTPLHNVKHYAEYYQQLKELEQCV